MGVDFLDRRVLAKRVVDGRKPASGHESQLRQGVASGHPQGRSAAKEPQSGLTRRNPLTFDPTCCGFSHSLFAIYARFYAAVNKCFASAGGASVRQLGECVAQRFRAVARDGERFQLVDPQIGSGVANAAPEARHESRRLQERQKLCFLGSRVPEHIVKRVGGCLSVHRDHRRQSQHQFRGGGEQTLPYRVGGHTVFQEVDHRPARVELRDLAERAEEFIACGVVPTALFPGLRDLSKHRLELPPSSIGR